MRVVRFRGFATPALSQYTYTVHPCPLAVYVYGAPLPSRRIRIRCTPALSQCADFATYTFKDGARVTNVINYSPLQLPGDGNLKKLTELLHHPESSFSHALIMEPQYAHT